MKSFTLPWVKCDLGSQSPAFNSSCWSMYYIIYKWHGNGSIPIPPSTSLVGSCLTILKTLSTNIQVMDILVIVKVTLFRGGV